MRSAIPADCHTELELGLYFEALDELGRYADLPETMPWKIVNRGIVLYGISTMGSLPHPYSRAEVVTQWLSRGHRSVQTAYRFHDTNTTDPGSTTILSEQAYFAAGWALRAALLAHRIDASDRKLRWNAKSLARLLELVHPTTETLDGIVEALPYWLDRERYGFVDEQVTSAQCAEAIAAAHDVLKVATDSAEYALGIELVESRRELLIEGLQHAFAAFDGVAVLLGPLPVDPGDSGVLRLVVATTAPPQQIRAALEPFEHEWRRPTQLDWLSPDAFADRIRQNRAAPWPEGRIVLKGDLSRLLDSLPDGAENP